MGGGVLNGIKNFIFGSDDNPTVETNFSQDNESVVNLLNEVINDVTTDIDTSTIKRDTLDYSLYLEDKEIKSGKLGDIKDNVLYTGEIEGKSKQKYKLYIWVTKEIDEKSVYEYKLEFNTIKTGGPGF